MQEHEKHKKLFGGTDRDESHRRLDKVRKGKKYPLACCREDPNDLDEPFQVWSGPPSAYVIVPPPAPVTPEGDPLFAGIPATMVDDIAKRVVELLTKGAP